MKSCELPMEYQTTIFGGFPVIVKFEARDEEYPIDHWGIAIDSWEIYNMKGDRIRFMEKKLVEEDKRSWPHSELEGLLEEVAEYVRNLGKEY